VYKDQGKIKLLEFAQALEEWGKVEKMPELEGKKMSILITPAKK
jgi:translation initiation factor IF-3